MPFNFPAPLPVTRFPPSLSYPLNLAADNRNYFTRISFIKYQPAYLKDYVDNFGDFLKTSDGAIALSAFSLIGGPIALFGGFSEYVYDRGANDAGAFLTNQGTKIGSDINLPIPKKVNEMNMMNWSEISLTGTLLNTAAKAAGGFISTGVQIGSSFAGVQLNPFILQYFQRPSFREFSFTWTLAPRNRKESEQIHKIINQIKARQAPRISANGFLMEYPDLAIVQFFPDDEFQINLKECVIVGVNVDYTPAGPSYIGGTAAPTMVNLTVHLKETKLWFSEEWAPLQRGEDGGLPDDRGFR